MAYSGPTTGPPGIGVGYPAPDGNSYFEILGAPQGLIDLYTLVIEAIARCLANGQKARDPVVKTYWNQSALKLRQALRRFESRLDMLAKDTANVATASVVRRINATQVRPDTSRQNRMRDNILSRPVVTPRPLGIVGVADMDVLNKTKRSRGNPFWAAQEFGTDAHVGRIVPGYFMPGRARPSAAEFRVHPEFQAVRRVRGTPAMRITKPIEERGFLRGGTDDAGLYRRRRLRSIERELIRVLNQVASTAPPTPRGAAPPGRGRRP